MKPTVMLLSRSDSLLARWESLLHSYDPIRLKPQRITLPGSATCQGVLLIDADSCKELTATVTRYSDLPVFALQGSPDNLQGHTLLHQGVRGYGNSYMRKENLNNAVQTLLDGAVWIYPELMQYLILHAPATPSSSSSLLTQLSPKEQDVAHLVARGCSNKEVASHMQITERTVKAHLSSIYQKLDVSDRLALALLIKEHHADR